MLGYGMPTITTHLGRVEAHKTMARVILKAQDKGPGPHPHVINCFVSLSSSPQAVLSGSTSPSPSYTYHLERGVLAKRST